MSLGNKSNDDHSVLYSNKCYIIILMEKCIHNLNYNIWTERSLFDEEELLEQ